ncbi:helix-turn-helix transcriptional regulator [Halobacteriovorax sp. YZS-1-1]|uniref:helix-turn-helix transcriptional regulator n=1 Tax=unclassified Halobacteriovorax TaxID=2639665 RepID=UPI00399A33C9
MNQNGAKWTFFSNHGHVYLLIAANEDIIVREIASRVGITERSVLGIIQDLYDAGYIMKEKVGRSNRYKIVPKKTLRHSLESNVQLQDLIDLITKTKNS